MKSILTISFAFILFTVHAGDTYSFNWTSNKKPVGELTLKVNQTDEETTYEYLSVLQVNTGIEMKMQEAWKCVYNDADVLVEVALENKFNGKPRISITEIKNTDGVVRTVNGREKVIERPAITYSYVRLFVQEPAGINEVYSELYGVMFSVVATGKNNYTVTDSKNRKHRFFYDDEGHLKRADLELSAGSFSLEPK